MKRIITKYIVLILVTFLTSILIYNYIESFKPVETEKDILIEQKERENSYLQNTDYSLDNPNIILNPYGNSPLTALVVFQTKDLTTPSVTIKGKDGGNDITHTFTPSKVHILPIYGLYADYENKVIINASNKSKEITIKTDKLPDDFTEITNIIPKTYSEDLYFTTPEDTGYTAAYDSNGDVRWYLIGDYRWNLQRLSNGHILISNNKTISKNYSAGLTEIDLLGKIYYEYIIPGGFYKNVIELNNGNLLALSNNLESDTVEDYIIEIDRSTGNIIKTIDLNKILKNKEKGNWFKATSLTYDSNTNSITITGYNKNILVNIDYSSLNLNWVIGKNIEDDLKNLKLNNSSNSSYPEKPLSVNMIGNNKIIFVNEINGQKSLTTYEINYSDRTFKEIDNLPLDTNEYAYLDIVEDGDYIITRNNNIEEIKDREKVVSININSSLYNTKKMPLYANDIYTGVDGIRLGTLGKSKTSNSYIVLFSSKDDKIIQKYNLSLHKDELGLKVTGNFNKKDSVQIILDNFLDKKTYKLDTGNKKDYRYISEDGIKGKYYIYLRINGKIYKLGNCVTFS